MKTQQKANEDQAIENQKTPNEIIRKPMQILATQIESIRKPMKIIATPIESIRKPMKVMPLKKQSKS